MNPNEREDSSKYVNQRDEAAAVRSIEAESTAASAAAAPTHKKSKAPLVLGLLLVMALIAAVVLGWLWYQQDAKASKLESDLSSARSQVKQLQASRVDSEAADEPTDISTDTASSDSDAVVKAALAYMQAPVNPVGGNSKEAEVAYLEGDFAKVIVTTTDVSPSGQSVSKLSFSVTLKQSNDDWIVLSAAEGPVADMNELMEKYGIPREAF